jgi:DNA-binding transcriptional regulator YiaG
VITGEQIRAARKLLGWHRGMVAIKARAGVSGNTVGTLREPSLEVRRHRNSSPRYRKLWKLPASSSRTARREAEGDEGAQGREVITGQQIKAARELLGWTPYRLAPRAGIGHTLLRQFEAGARVPDEASAGRLRAALEEAGVIFTADGVKLSRNLRGGRVPEQLNAEKDG